MIRSWVWLALEKHDHPWALVPRAGSIRVGGHLEMTMIAQWLGGYGWLKIKLLEVRKKNNHYDMYPSTSWDFFQFHSWIFFTRASLDLKTQKSHQRRDPSILRCLWFYPHINLWEVDTCLRRRSVVPLGATDGSIHWKGFFLRWRTWCWRKNGPNILQIVQVLSLFCWELKKWCVRKWCVYSIHTYCKYHICDMCIATAVQPSLVW